ncbi:MAG: hypothetical protein OHK0056_31470 [Bacteriovoracaceae bacterium]
MKPLLSVLFSLSLWFGQVVLPAAYADEASTGTSEVTVQPAPSSGGVDRRYTNPEEFAPKEEKEKKKDKGLFGYAGLTMTNIVLFATVGGSVSIMMSCWDQMSSKIFVGATTLFATMEVLNWVNYKKTSDRELTYYRNQDHNTQVASLEAAAAQTEEAAKTAKQRAMLAKLAAAGMMAAGVMALYEGYRASAECKAAMAASMGAGAPACVPPTKSDWCKGKLIGLNSFSDPILYYASTKRITDQLKEAQNDTDAFFIAREYDSFITGGLQSPSYKEYEEYSKITELSSTRDETNLKDLLVSFYESAGDIFISNAYAQGQMTAIISGVGGGVLGGILATQITIEGTKFEFMKEGYFRGAGFAAAGAMAYGAGSQIQNAANKMQERANEYRKLATTMKSKFTSSGGLANRESQQRIQSEAIGRVATHNNEQIDSACVTGGPGVNMNLDVNCSCRQDNSCKTSDVPKIDHKAFSGASVIANTTDLIGSASNSLGRGDLAGASRIANGASNLAARVNRLKNSLQGYINAKRKDSGEKPIDFAGLEKSNQKQMIEQVNQAFNKMTDQQRADLAKFAPGLGTENGEKVAESKPVEFKENENYNKNNVVSNTASGTATANESLDFKFDLDEKGEELTALDPSLLEGSDYGALNASSSDYDNPEGSDISPAHESLWNIIHRRYLKNYDRFFARKKTEF